MNGQPAMRNACMIASHHQAIRPSISLAAWRVMPSAAIATAPTHRSTTCRYIQSSKAVDDAHFDSTKDYNYHLGKLPGAKSHNVNLTSNGFLWPESVDQTADTAFLEISIEDTQNNVADPSIRANSSTKGDNAVHYFEQNAAGRRYLDLSPLLPLDPGDKIELFSDDGTKWQTDKSTTLATFSNPSVTDKRVLVLSPHPDDAEIAAFGLYTSSRAHIVTITAGDAGKPKFGNLWNRAGEQYRAKGRIRTIDSLAVPLLGGLRPEAVRNLGYYDGTLEEMCKSPHRAVKPKHAILEDSAYFRSFNFCEELRGRPFSPCWAGLIADLVAELEKVQPDVVVAPHVLLDRHPDHQYTTFAVCEALKRWNRHCTIFLYTNHAMANEAYPFGPRSGVMGLPPADRHAMHPMFISGLYSHQISTEVQRQKLTALEAMHDLRSFDLLDGSDVISPPQGLDYYRRGGRPNEIFYITDFAGVWGMCQQFLGS